MGLSWLWILRGSRLLPEGIQPELVLRRVVCEVEHQEKTGVRDGDEVRFVGMGPLYPGTLEWRGLGRGRVWLEPEGDRTLLRYEFARLGEMIIGLMLIACFGALAFGVGLRDYAIYLWIGGAIFFTLVLRLMHAWGLREMFADISSVRSWRYPAIPKKWMRRRHL